MPDTGDHAKQQSINDYYSAAQLRSDRWISLRDAVEAALDTSARERKKLNSEITGLFSALEPIERYWAFPGAAAFQQLQRMFANDALNDLVFSLKRVVRALSTGAYRRRNVPLSREDGDWDDVEDESTLPIEARALTKPYFEVLIVDNAEVEVSSTSMPSRKNGAK